MTLSQILLVSLFVILNSCDTSKKEESPIEKISILSFKKSNEVSLNLSNKNYSSLQDKLREVIYGEKIEFWNGKALKLKTLTSEFVSNLDPLKVNNHFSLDTINFLTRTYIHDVQLIDTTLYKIVKEGCSEFSANMAKDLSPEFIIEKTMNDVLLSESKMSSYLDNKTSMIVEDFTIFSTLVSQSTKHLKAGETLEITAGIGSYSVAANPIFIINGNIVKSDESATAKYTLKVSGTGKKTIPVKIFYISNNGSKESKEIEVEYYVDK